MRVFRALVLAVPLVFGFAGAACAQARTYYINPAAATNGDGSMGEPYNTWAGVIFTPGDTYLQLAGTTYNGVILDTVAATLGSQITFAAYGNGARPIISAVDFAGASYASISGFQIMGEITYAAVSIQQYRRIP